HASPPARFAMLVVPPVPEDRKLQAPATAAAAKATVRAREVGVIAAECPRSQNSAQSPRQRRFLAPRADSPGLTAAARGLARPSRRASPASQARLTRARSAAPR